MIEKALLTVTMTLLGVLGTYAVSNQIIKISTKINTVARSAANPLTQIVPCTKTGAETGAGTSCYSSK